jgi:hypothetical protein
MRSGPARRMFAILMLIGMIFAGYGTCNAYERHPDENDCLECVADLSAPPQAGEGEAPSFPHHCPNDPCCGHLSLAPGPSATPILFLPVAIVPSAGTPAPKFHSLAPPDQPPRV